MDEQPTAEGAGVGAGFASERGRWQPLPRGGEFDPEQTGYTQIGIPLPDLSDFPGVNGRSTPAAGTGELPPDLAPDLPPPSAEASPAEVAPEVEPSGAPGADLERPVASYLLSVNGTEYPVTDAWIGESLLHVLRERLGLVGAKDGCGQGECGACSVQVDGRLVASCLVPAATAAGCEIRTVEGLSENGEPSDVQRALAASGAAQCGYCLPGFAMTVHDLLEGNHQPTDVEIRQALSGNLCRCSGYHGVLDAVHDVIASRSAAAQTAAGDGAGAAADAYADQATATNGSDLR